MIAKFKWIGRANLLKLFGSYNKNLVLEMQKKIKTVMVIFVRRDVLDNLSGKVLNTKTNSLRNSIKTFTKIKGNTIIAGVSADLKVAPHARIHEFGGIIRPVKGKFLTIPVGNTKGFARDYPNSFFFKSKKGGLFLGRTINNKVEALFLLVTKVEIPKRPYITPAILKNIPKMEKAILSLKEKDFK